MQSLDAKVGQYTNAIWLQQLQEELAAQPGVTGVTSAALPVRKHCWKLSSSSGQIARSVTERFKLTLGEHAWVRTRDEVPFSN